MVETFIFCWVLFEVAEDREPVNIEELAEAMSRNPATLYRWQQDFRRAFPDLATPHQLVPAFREQLGQRITPQRVGSTELGGLGLA
jgi:transposase-like protein